MGPNGPGHTKFLKKLTLVKVGFLGSIPDFGVKTRDFGSCAVFGSFSAGAKKIRSGGPEV